MVASLAPPTFSPYSPLPDFRFEIIHQSNKPGSRARVGRIHTPHGVIDTPGFVPVATNAALKGLTNEQSAACGTQLMFANTYHLLVHPGPEIVEAAGGLHKFMGRSQPMITDSGGSSLAQTNEEDGPELKRRSAKRGSNGRPIKARRVGTLFRSYLDGSTIELTPESTVRAQKALGADIIIPLDELPPYHCSRDRLAKSVSSRTAGWRDRCARIWTIDALRQCTPSYTAVSIASYAHSASYLSRFHLMATLSAAALARIATRCWIFALRAAALA